MTGRFSAIVRFDAYSREILISVGGRVEPDAVDELCDVIGRSVHIAGRPAEVDVTDADLAEETFQELCKRCDGFATVTPSPEPEESGPVQDRGHDRGLGSVGQP